MFKVTYRPMWQGVLFTCLFIQMIVLLVTQVTIIKDYLLPYLVIGGRIKKYTCREENKKACKNGFWLLDSSNWGPTGVFLLLRN